MTIKFFDPQQNRTNNRFEKKKEKVNDNVSFLNIFLALQKMEILIKHLNVTLLYLDDDMLQSDLRVFLLTNLFRFISFLFLFE